MRAHSERQDQRDYLAAPRMPAHPPPACSSTAFPRADRCIKDSLLLVGLQTGAGRQPQADPSSLESAHRSTRPWAGTAQQIRRDHEQVWSESCRSVLVWGKTVAYRLCFRCFRARVTARNSRHSARQRAWMISLERTERALFNDVRKSCWRSRRPADQCETRWPLFRVEA